MMLSRLSFRMQYDRSLLFLFLFTLRGCSGGGTQTDNASVPDRSQPIQSKADDAETYYNQGNAYAKSGDYVKAVSAFTQTLHLTPDADYVYVHRGSAYYRQRDYAHAISDYTQALRLSPKDALVYVQRGIAYHAQGNYTQAITDFNQAIRLKPDSAQAYEDRGFTWLDMHNFDNAWADVKQCRAVGGTPNPEFIQLLEKETGRKDAGH